MGTVGNRRRVALAGATVCLAAIGAASAVALGDSGGRRVNSANVDNTAHYSQLQTVSAQMSADFPVLSKTPDSEEMRQLPMVARAIESLGKLPGGLGGAGANPALARMYYRVGENAGYLVPGNADVLCSVQIYEGKPIGAGCGTASTWLAKGSVSTTVVPGGYEVSGLLPRGTKQVSVTGADGHTSSVDADAYGGFDFVGAGAITRIAYKLPNGREEVDSSRFPPPTPGAG